MSEVTRILNALEQGDSQAVDKLLPVVYRELRTLATQKLSRERPGQTLQATALVHEAYLRLVGSENAQFSNHAHFFGAAAEAMRRILVENARRKKALKLFGTPAEETVVGKVYMAKAGIFEGLDAVIEWHPSDDNEVRNQTGRAMNSLEVEFFGQAAHGSADPWNGRSALDAVELMNYGVNLMREHTKPTGVDLILRTAKTFVVALAGVIAQIFVHWAINLGASRQTLRPNG